MTTPSPDNPKRPAEFKRTAGWIVEVDVEVVGNNKTLPDYLKGYKPFIGVPKPPPSENTDTAPTDKPSSGDESAA